VDVSAKQSLNWEVILNHSSVGIAQVDVSGRYTSVNEQYCRMLARSQQDLLRLTIQDITHPENLASSLDAFIRAIEVGGASMIEQRCVRGDGSYVWVSNNVSVARDDRGGPQFLVILAQDITEWKSTKRALGRAEADLRLLLDTAADGFYCVNREGVTTLCNAAFVRMAGFKRADEVIGRYCYDVVHLERLEGLRYAIEEHPIYKAARYGTHAHLLDETLRRIDGEGIPVEYWVRPIVSDGQIQGAVCSIIDISERKNADSRQDLLNHELAHRVKNTLAVVQAIVGQTLRDAATPREAIGAINARLFALSRAHTLLMKTRWGNAPIVDVIEAALASHAASTERLRTTGPRIDVGPRAALAITMALHELSTNAVKYGALSNSAGTVSLDWSVVGGAADSHFRLSWKESGGPSVAPPARKGFGSRVIAESFGADFGGRSALRFEPTGVSWVLEVPLGSIQK
jgi:PAS domain S-box-containing protein